MSTHPHHNTRVQSYLEMDYTMKVIPDIDYDDSIYFIASYEELPGLIGTGDTEALAKADLLEVAPSWFEQNIELGRDIPLPDTATE